MPGHFSITKRDFGSTWPDVWGFRSHFTHNKRGKETGEKKNHAKQLKQNQNSALQATRETMKYKRKYNKREQKKGTK
jgi:hypothetical protein